jgi:amidase
MQRLARHGNLVYTHSAANPPRMSVDPGEHFQIETELNSGDWLEDMTSDPTVNSNSFPYVNPATGPVFVNGAKPGDMLSISIHDIELDQIGYTQVKRAINPFKSWIDGDRWGAPFRVVRIADGFVEWSDSIRIPVAPMIGVIGTAPEIEGISNADNGKHGGNLDVQEVTIGNTIHLPVLVDGALLHIGDVHAVQGDGELCTAGGIETRSVVTASVTISPRPDSMSWPRIETPTHVATLGCARPLDDAFRIAVEEMIYWMADETGCTSAEALMLLGQVAEARATQFVNPKYTYICKVARQYFVR